MSGVARSPGATLWVRPCPKPRRVVAQTDLGGVGMAGEAKEGPLPRQVRLVRAVLQANPSGVAFKLDAQRGGGASDQALVFAAAVHVRHVEESHPKTDRAVDRGDGFLVIARAVELRHPHAPESER